MQLSGTSDVAPVPGLVTVRQRWTEATIGKPGLAGVRAEGAGVRPGLAFSTASFKDGCLGSQSPCPTGDPLPESSSSLFFDSSVKRHRDG